MELSFELTLVLAALMFVGAILYTSVGHGGASAYLAFMGLFGVPAEVMRPTGLILNVIVSSFTSFRYFSVGFFEWRVLWPFLLGAIPIAFIGGAIRLPGHFYKPLVAIVLFVAAIKLLWPNAMSATREVRPPPVVAGILIGAVIGLLSGLTGTGGGIFLSPILMFMGWCEPRRASGVASVFILCNSLSGLAGNASSVSALPSELPIFAVAVLSGAVIGTFLGIRKLPVQGILKALGVVLIIAGFKLLGLY